MATSSNPIELSSDSDSEISQSGWANYFPLVAYENPVVKPLASKGPSDRKGEMAPSSSKTSQEPSHDPSQKPAKQVLCLPSPRWLAMKPSMPNFQDKRRKAS